jgi:hypothetical protein
MYFTKKLTVFLFALSLAALVFAEPKSTGLTSSDIKNWAKNVNSIHASFADLGLYEEEITSATKEQKVQAEAVLLKNGISGPNSIEKYAMLTQCATLLMAEDEMGGADAQSLALLKSMGMDPLAELRKNVNSKDYEAVKANSSLVLNAMKGIDEPVAEKPKSSSKKSGKGDLSDLAETQIELVRSQNPDMDDETAEILAEQVRKSSSYGLSQKMWDLQRSEAKKYSEEIEVEADRTNAYSEKLKAFYDSLSKSKGDSGFLYKKLDKENGTKYKKVPLAYNSVIIYPDWDDDYDSGLGTFNVEITIFFEDMSVHAAVTWTEASVDNSSSVMNRLFAQKQNNEVKKTLDFSIKSVDHYKILDKNLAPGEELVITTKEGLVLHCWSWLSVDGNAWRSAVGSNGYTGEIPLSCSLGGLD